MENNKQNTNIEQEKSIDEIMINDDSDLEFDYTEDIEFDSDDLNTDIIEQEDSDDGEPANSVEEDCNHFLRLTIDELDLSTRACNCLRRAGIQSVQDIISRIHSIEDFNNIRNMGRLSSEEVCEKLAEYGFILVPEQGFIFKANDGRKKITQKNYKTYFEMHRQDLNHKLKVNQESFAIRGMSPTSIGFTKLYISLSDEIRGMLNYNITFSDEFDYSSTRLEISVVAKDSESFIVDQARAKVKGTEISLLANAIDEADVIEVSAVGALPPTRPPKNISQEFTRLQACGVDFDIDFGSFERQRMKLLAYGFRQEKDGRKCHSIIMAEVSQLENGRGEELPTIRLCAVLYQDGAIIEMGSTEIVDYRGRFIGNMARIKIETSTDVSVSSIKLYIKAD